MKYIFHIYLAVILVCSTNTGRAQSRDANAIIEGVKQKFLLIKDYKAAVKIKVDVDFIKIPVKNGYIWFVQPDQVKVKTQGFSLLPKRGMNFSPNKLFQGNYTAIYAREEKSDSLTLQVIRLVPQDEKEEIIISTVWIDEKRNVIRKLEATTRNEGTYEMKFIYPADIGKWDLPSTIIFNFDLRKNELPLGMTGDFETSRPEKKGSSTSRGTVTVTYLNYEVNTGKGLEGFRKATKK